MFGEEMQNGGASGLYANDPVVNQLDALQLGIGKLSKEVRGVHLTAGEYDDYARIAGRLTKIRLDQLVRAPNWSAVPDFAKIETIHKIVENSRKAAGAQLWAENPQLLQRANADKQADLEQRQTDLAAVGR